MKLDEKGINALNIFGDLNLLKRKERRPIYGMAFVIFGRYKKKLVNFREQFKLLIDDEF